MPGFLDRLREGAEKAAFEAERLRRLTQAQSQLRALGRQLDERVAALGQQALALYDSGALSQPELLTGCEGIDALRQQIADQEARIEQIREETPPETQVPPATITCPECGAHLPLEARFCNSCGASVKPAAEPESLEVSLLQVCPSCQAEIPAEAIFCPECGQPVVPAPVDEVDEEEPPAEETVAEEVEPAAEEEEPPVDEALVVEDEEAPVVEDTSGEDESPVMVACESCGATMPLDADFCPECGSPVGGAESDAE
jgi:rRNA maturation endonuclease Nob1